MEKAHHNAKVPYRDQRIVDNSEYTSKLLKIFSSHGMQDVQCNQRHQTQPRQDRLEDSVEPWERTA